LKVASWASWTLGHPARGLDESVASLALARELDHPMSIIVALAWACVFHDLRRDIEQVGEHARALIDLATEHDASQWLAMGTIFDGAVRVHLGEGEAAMARIRDGLTAYASTGAHLFIPYFLSLLARAYLTLGEPRPGLHVIADALERARTTGELLWEAELLRLQGELRLAAFPEQLGDVRDCLRDAIEIARRQDARSWELRAALSLARVCATVGERDESRQTLARVYASFTEGFDTADLREVAAVLSA
jgi:predicted ATPase